jgi:MFS family permease
MKKNTSSSYAWLNPNLIGFSLASFFSDVSREMVTAIFPTFFTQLVGPSAPWFVGIMGSLSEAVASGTKLISGLLSDRLRVRKPFIVLGYAVATLCTGLIALASSARQIIIFETTSRIGKGLREPARDALLANSVEPAYYGRAFGFNRAMDTCGAIIGPIIALIFLTRIGARSLIAWSIVPGILAVLSIIIYVKETSLSRETPAHATLSIRESIIQLPFSFIFFLFVMFVFGSGNFHKTLFILRSQELLTPRTGLTSAENISIALYVLFSCVEAISNYMLGLMSDKIGRKKLLSIAGFLAFGISSLLLGYAHSFLSITTAFILTGISQAATASLTKSYAADLLPKDIRGLGYGALQATDGFAKLIASFTVGTLWTAFSPAVGFSYAAATSICAAFLLTIKK